MNKLRVSVVTLLACSLVISFIACRSQASPESSPFPTPESVTTLPTEPSLPPSPQPSSEPDSVPAPVSPEANDEDEHAATQEPTTLRQLAGEKPMLIGTYFTPDWFSYQTWREVVGREFNMAMLYPGLLWKDIEPRQNYFDFSMGDEQVQFALSKDMVICSHLLAPSSSYDNPDWVVNSYFSEDELKEILRNHIATVMNHYKGQISLWMVVEEAYLESYTGEDFLYQKFSYDYLDLAYQIARDTDPSATLIYNDYDNHTPDGATTGLTKQIVERLKAKGLIDGVGLEMHLDGSNPPSKQDMINTMRGYGIPVYVTELDIDMKSVPGTQEERYSRQAEIYRDIIEACLESGVCEGFCVWGIGDKYSWLEWTSSKADPTMYDDDLNPKPAYFAVFDALAHAVGQ